MATIYQGDALATLRQLPDGLARCCVTSPPYWGLRDYGTAKWEGGDDGCDHVKGTAASATSTLKNDGRPNPGSNNYERSIVVPYRGTCGKCGARRIDAQLGLEPTPDAYIASMVEVFREVRRVLADDGTLWLNLGDSYAGSWGAQSRGDFTPGTLEGASSEETCLSARQILAHPKGTQTGSLKNTPWLKAKDLVGIPWRVALALQADGWWLRQDIIWHKPNPMPESVTDRCTKAHEYMFLLSKSGNAKVWRARDTAEWSRTPDLSERLPAPTDDDPDATVARWRGFDYYYDAEAIAEPARFPEGSGLLDSNKYADAHSRGDERMRTKAGLANIGPRETRNRRSVWTVATAPYPEAHFATYPPALITPCILAGSAPGDTVLDPFTGSGTTGAVACKWDRAFVGIELKPEYISLAARRVGAETNRLF
jgi:DNA modification methylase